MRGRRRASSHIGLVAALQPNLTQTTIIRLLIFSLNLDSNFCVDKYKIKTN
jgi:hypothetical protein